MSSYHYSFYSPTDYTACRVCSPTDFTACCGYSPTDFTDLHRLFGCLQGGALVSSAPTKQNRYSPTESTEPTELLAEDVLPQISQNLQNCLLSVFSHRFHRLTQNCLLRIFSHRFHRFTQKLGCLQGGALVSARLCRLPEQEVHQPSKKCTNQAKSIFSHGIHRTHRTSCRVYSPTDCTDLHRS